MNYSNRRKSGNKRWSYEEICELSRSITQHEPEVKKEETSKGIYNKPASQRKKSE